jgi:hypothetical protein
MLIASRLLLAMLLAAVFVDVSIADDAKPFALNHPRFGSLMRAASSDGAATPKELVERLYAGFKAGDGKKVASCFDRRTEEGRIAAVAFAVLAEHDAAALRLEDAAKKFGEPGTSLIRDETGVHTEDALREAHAIRDADPQSLRLLGDESTGKLVVHLPIRQIRPPSLLREAEPGYRLIQKRNDRWFLIEPTTWKLSEDSQSLLEFQIVLWADRIESYKGRLPDVQKCRTLQELIELLTI